MRRKRPGGRRLQITEITPAIDRELQRRVIALALSSYPTLLTIHALAAELLEGPEGFLASYALARAVRDLVVAGLLQSDGLFVSPTAAALCFQALAVS